jgi:thiamine biosynthesis protein ThiS
MRITLNNRETVLEGEELTVRQVLTAMNYTFPMIVVRINGSVVPKLQYESALVHDGDVVDAFHLIGGG